DEVALRRSSYRAIPPHRQRLGTSSGLAQLVDAGLVSAATWEQLAPELEEQIRGRLEAHRALLRERPALETEALADARQEGLRAQRAALMTLLSEGLLSEEVYEELVTEVDRRLDPPASAGAAPPPPPVP